MEADRHAAADAWATARFSLDELSTLIALIQHHDRRLQTLGGTVAPEGVLDAVLADAATDPVLGGALMRAWVMDQQQRIQHAAEN
jgi:hypothetical protein